MDEAGRKACEKLRADLAGKAIVSAPTYAAHDPWDLWRARPNVLRALVR
jgi:hypothetical protein